MLIVLALQLLFLDVAEVETADYNLFEVERDYTSFLWPHQFGHWQVVNFNVVMCLDNSDGIIFWC